MSNMIDVEAIQEKLKTYSSLVINHQKNKLDHLEHSLHLVDPEKVLKKGYSITLINGKQVNRIGRIKKDDNIMTKTLNWEISGTVDTASKRKNG